MTIAAEMYGGARSGPIQGIDLPEHEPVDDNDMDLSIRFPDDDPMDLAVNRWAVAHPHHSREPQPADSSQSSSCQISDSDLMNYKRNAVDSDGELSLVAVSSHSRNSVQTRSTALLNDSAHALSASSRAPSMYSAASNSRTTAHSDEVIHQPAPTPASHLTSTTTTARDPSTTNDPSGLSVPTPTVTEEQSAPPTPVKDIEQGMQDVTQKSNETASSTEEAADSEAKAVAKKPSSTCKWLLVSVLALILLAGVAVTGIVCGTGGCSSRSSSDESAAVSGAEDTAEVVISDTILAPEPTSGNTISPTFSPTTAVPTPAPTTGLPTTPAPTTLVPDVPVSTLEAMNDFTTPQGKAFFWVRDYPNFEALPAWRKRQLFAMVTFYWAMNGPTWPLNRRFQWLDTSVNECEWKSIQTSPCDLENEMEFLGLLNDPNLQGSIPPEIGFLTQLEELSIVDCGLQGTAKTVLPELVTTSLSNLRLLHLEGNALTGTIPARIANFTSLQYLYLQDNPWSGTLPKEIGGMANLKGLDLSNTGVSGPIPVEWGALTKLEVLDLTGTSLTGSIPQEICDLPLLTTLAADCDKVTCCN